MRADIKVGSIYQGLINNCIIRIDSIYTENNISNTEMVKYTDLENNKIGYAPLKRLQQSLFVEVVKI